MNLLPSLLLLLASFGSVQAGPGTLFDSALRMERAGRLDIARVDLQRLIKSYPAAPFAARARTELDAVSLFQEGQHRLKIGSARLAVVTFRTFVQVYPESPLATQAEAAGRDAEKREPRPARIVGAIEFHGAWPVSMEAINRRFEDHEVALALDAPYRAGDVERARIALVELLRESGAADDQVKSETAAIKPRGMMVAFTVVKP
jgi:hypothetical protein